MPALFLVTAAVNGYDVEANMVGAGRLVLMAICVGVVILMLDFLTGDKTKR